MVSANDPTRNKKQENSHFLSLKESDSSSSLLCAPKIKIGNVVIIKERVRERHHRRRSEIGDRKVGPGIASSSPSVKGWFLAFSLTLFWISWDFSCFRLGFLGFPSERVFGRSHRRHRWLRREAAAAVVLNGSPPPCRCRKTAAGAD